MTNPQQTTNHHETVSRTAGYLSFLSVNVFFILLVVLYFLEPEFNPPHLISEYELGRFGWLMSLAFFCLGSASLFLLRAIWPDLRTKGGLIGRWWLLLIGIAYIGAGVFIPDPAPTVESFLHGISGIIVIFSSPIVFTLLSRSLGSNQRWSGILRLLKWTTLLAWIGLLSFFASIIIFSMHVARSSILGGWSNRFMIATYCAWLITVAWQAIKFNGPKEFAAKEKP